MFILLDGWRGEWQVHETLRKVSSIWPEQVVRDRSGRLAPVEITLMIEGQEDVTWDDWVAIAEACERSGIGTLFRSDHYLSVEDRRERGSLDAWATLAALAAVTEKLRLGTMVSPATFRHPSVFAKLAATVDQISGGRCEPASAPAGGTASTRPTASTCRSSGRGWTPSKSSSRSSTRSWEDGAFSFSGEHFSVVDLDARPKPVQRPMPIIIGGSGGPRSLRIAARWAAEYNTVFAGPESDRASCAASSTPPARASTATRRPCRSR